MINSPKGNRTDVSGVMFRKLLVLRSLHTCKQTSWRKEKMNNKKLSVCYWLVFIPVLLVYLFCQKWIMNGVVAGAVK